MVALCRRNANHIAHIEAYRGGGGVTLWGVGGGGRVGGCHALGGGSGGT
jgi:hypothetical protein